MAAAGAAVALATGRPVRLADMVPYCAKYAKDAWRYEFPLEAYRKGPNRIVIGPQKGATASVVWCEIAVDVGEPERYFQKAG